MNVEFHYYIVHFLADRAGIDPDTAHLIARSSQYVDDCIISYKVKTPEGKYRIHPTQNYGFWDKSFPREVYIPFHFFPGDTDHDGAIRKDLKVNPYNTTPGSSNARELLVRALKTRNPYRIGIALHTYADTWAHQNFSGKLEDWNRIQESTMIPPIGHAQAVKNPDIFTNKWEDPRLVNPEVDNRVRFMKAARMIYKFLCTYNKKDYEDIEFTLDELEEVLGKPGSERPMQERILDIIVAGSIEKYDRSLWLKEAVVLKNPAVNEHYFKGYDKVLWAMDALVYKNQIMNQPAVDAKQGFKESHLFHWHEASRQHIWEARDILRTCF